MSKGVIWLTLALGAWVVMGGAIALAVYVLTAWGV
jgi:hypothetical protein